MKALLKTVIGAGEDFEWYPTTQRMIDAVGKDLVDGSGDIMDIGAGDGRVLIALAAKMARSRKLYSIEKSTTLIQAQPDEIIPVGSDFFEQNLACLQTDYIFCNPPYSQFETWVSIIIESGYAKHAYLVIPQRWKESKQIELAIKKRGAVCKVIHSDDFLDAERRARAVVDIVRVSYPKEHDYSGARPVDPFNIWFDQNISTFDQHEEISDYDQLEREIARIHKLESISEMVEAYNEEYARMEENYRSIFKLDFALLKELNVNKEGVREGIKKRIAGLKTKYWQGLFEHLAAIQNRLSTETRKRFLDKLTGSTSVAFTTSNAYAVVLWAIKNASKYCDEQCVQLFRELSTFEGVLNYNSNRRTWAKNGWRYSKHRGPEKDDPTHYALDFRIVVGSWMGIEKSYDNHPTTNLRNEGNELIEDVIAVLATLGFSLFAYLGQDGKLRVEQSPRSRLWHPGDWQDWRGTDGEILFQAKAHLNGNLHFRFRPEAIKTLNVEAGRLLGWLRSPEDVATEMGLTPSEASSYFGASRKIGMPRVPLLADTKVGAA